jgi:hypothetical protein
VRPATSDAPHPLGAPIDVDHDTRTAATFDSNPHRERNAATWWVAGGVALSVLFATVGGVLIVQSRKTALAAREPAQYVPEVVELAPPPPQADPPAAESARPMPGAVALPTASGRPKTAAAAKAPAKPDAGRGADSF